MTPIGHAHLPPSVSAQVPPPGTGLTTVTEAVPGWRTSEAGTLAFNSEPLTKVVASGLPFHFTIAPETNPVPSTVRVNPPAPGVAASGSSGWLTTGTGCGDVEAS